MSRCPICGEMIEPRQAEPFGKLIAPPPGACQTCRGAAMMEVFRDNALGVNDMRLVAHLN